MRLRDRDLVSQLVQEQTQLLKIKVLDDFTVYFVIFKKDT